jgi:hypothetical protein
VIVVIPTVSESVFENVFLNSSVKNCGCFEFVITFFYCISCSVHCISNDMVNCRLKGEGSVFGEG